MRRRGAEGREREKRRQGLETRQKEARSAGRTVDRRLLCVLLQAFLLELLSFFWIFSPASLFPLHPFSLFLPFPVGGGVLSSFRHVLPACQVHFPGGQGEQSIIYSGKISSISSPSPHEPPSPVHTASAGPSPPPGPSPQS